MRASWGADHVACLILLTGAATLGLTIGLWRHGFVEHMAAVTSVVLLGLWFCVFIPIRHLLGDHYAKLFTIGSALLLMAWLTM